VKVVGKSGILLTSVAMVPERQFWTLQEPDRGRMARGLAWAAHHAARETGLASLVRRRPRPKGAKRGRKAR
jgi:hypothetical protein